jgi:hypothetical protein
VPKSIGAQLLRGKAKRLKLFTIERCMASREASQVPTGELIA